MDTRIRVMTIVDYKNFYGISKPVEDAAKLIENIPSVSLLYYISFFNTQIYLQDHPEDHKVQIALIQTLTTQAGAETQQKFKEVLAKYHSLNQLPFIIWNYSNLLFYELIFTNFNSLKSRELNPSEIKRVLDAYLIINSITDERFNFPEEEITKYVDNNNIELFTVSRFMYQRDYFSSTEMQNQVVRGCLFFEYLENHPDYNAILRQYYEGFKVSSYLEMFGNLLVLFTEAFRPNKDGIRNPILDLSEYKGLLNLGFLDSISVNNAVSGYKKDLNFTVLRNKILYKISDYKYMVLNMNFLVNYFYKTHIFALNVFLKNLKITEQFLSVKAKEFMEDIYFRKIIRRCFSGHILHFGDTAILPKNKELCDAYLRVENKIGIFELKDVLLNAEIKDSADVKKIIKAIETKFLVNEFDKAKGINQIMNALDFLKSQAFPFDPEMPENPEIFPIIVYTDDAFSSDGLNKILNKIFQIKLRGFQSDKIKVHPLTVINLHFFEIFEEHFSQSQIDLFDLISRYHVHISDPDYHLTPFEIFAKSYVQENMHLESRPTEIYNEYQKIILKNFLPLV